MTAFHPLATTDVPYKDAGAMPRFYFHVSNGTGFTQDLDGEELSDIDAARVVAILGAREIMAADIKDGELDLTSSIRVEDENGLILFGLTFEQAIKITR